MSYQAALQQLDKETVVTATAHFGGALAPQPIKMKMSEEGEWLPHGIYGAEVFQDARRVVLPDGHVVKDHARSGEEDRREVFEATAILYTGEETTLRVSKIGGHWHPLGEEASNKFRTANRVVLPDGTVIKDREAPVEAMVRCPFHKGGAEDNPSMRVLPDGTFFCFACYAKECDKYH